MSGILSQPKSNLDVIYLNEHIDCRLRQSNSDVILL